MSLRSLQLLDEGGSPGPREYAKLIRQALASLYQDLESLRFSAAETISILKRLREAAQTVRRWSNDGQIHSFAAEKTIESDLRDSEEPYSSPDTAAVFDAIARECSTPTSIHSAGHASGIDCSASPGEASRRSSFPSRNSSLSDELQGGRDARASAADGTETAESTAPERCAGTDLSPGRKEAVIESGLEQRSQAFSSLCSHHSQSATRLQESPISSWHRPLGGMRCASAVIKRQTYQRPDYRQDNTVLQVNSDRWGRPGTTETSEGLPSEPMSSLPEGDRGTSLFDVGSVTDICENAPNAISACSERLPIVADGDPSGRASSPTVNTENDLRSGSMSPALTRISMDATDSIFYHDGREFLKDVFQNDDDLLLTLAADEMNVAQHQYGAPALSPPIYIFQLFSEGIDGISLESALLLTRLFYALGSNVAFRQLRHALQAARKASVFSLDLSPSRLITTIDSLDQLDAISEYAHILRRFLLVRLLRLRQDREDVHRRQISKVLTDRKLRKHDVARIDAIRKGLDLEAGPRGPSSRPQVRKRRADSQALVDILLMSGSSVTPEEESIDTTDEDFARKIRKLRYRLACGRNWLTLSNTFSVGILALIPHGKETCISIDQLEKLPKSHLASFVQHLRLARGEFLQRAGQCLSEHVMAVLGPSQPQENMLRLETVDDDELMRMPYDSQELMDLCLPG